jgi:hypothetical protein
MTSHGRMTLHTPLGRQDGYLAIGGRRHHVGVVAYRARRRRLRRSDQQIRELLGKAVGKIVHLDGRTGHR